MPLLGFPVFCLSSSIVLNRYFHILVNSMTIWSVLKVPKIAWPSPFNNLIFPKWVQHCFFPWETTESRTLSGAKNKTEVKHTKGNQPRRGPGGQVSFCWKCGVVKLQIKPMCRWPVDNFHSRDLLKFYQVKEFTADFWEVFLAVFIVWKRKTTTTKVQQCNGNIAILYMHLSSLSLMTVDVLHLH